MGLIRKIVFAGIGVAAYVEDNILDPLAARGTESQGACARGLRTVVEETDAAGRCAKDTFWRVVEAVKTPPAKEPQMNTD